MADRRASDADRERAQASLRTHYAAGRIDDGELESRLAAAVSAPTLAALAALTDDLEPPPPPPPTFRRTTTDESAFGLRPFRQQHELECDRQQAWRKAMEHIAPSMSAYGYELTGTHEPDFMTFELGESPGWPWLFGPLAVLLASDRQTRVVVSFRSLAPERTLLVAEGTARRPVRRAFAELSA